MVLKVPEAIYPAASLVLVGSSIAPADTPPLTIIDWPLKAISHSVSLVVVKPVAKSNFVNSPEAGPGAPCWLPPPTGAYKLTTFSDFTCTNGAGSSSSLHDANPTNNATTIKNCFTHRITIFCNVFVIFLWKVHVYLLL